MPSEKPYGPASPAHVSNGTVPDIEKESENVDYLTEMSLEQINLVDLSLLSLPFTLPFILLKYVQISSCDRRIEIRLR